VVARIYRPAKTAMQSGQAKTSEWRLDFEPETPRVVEPLMGYTSSTDMRQQVRIDFPTKEEAIAFAEKNGLAYEVFDAHEPKRRLAAYSDNFKFNRVGAWTH
jgi:ETC complex I subunit conserved region